MPVEGINQTGGGGQVEEPRRHTENVARARDEDIEEKAQARENRAFGEVDETAGVKGCDRHIPRRGEDFLARLRIGADVILGRYLLAAAVAQADAAVHAHEPGAFGDPRLAFQRLRHIRYGPDGDQRYGLRGLHDGVDHRLDAVLVNGPWVGLQIVPVKPW